MITIEKINQKLGFDVNNMPQSNITTEYDPSPSENPFSALTDEEQDFLIEYRIKKLGLKVD